MLRKVLRGMKAKLSWLCPNVLPTFSATPTTRKGMPANRISLSSGSTSGKQLLHEVLADDADPRVVLVVAHR